MISNPATWFVNSMDEQSFTYEGGKTLYHFSPMDNGLSETGEMNVVFFADSPAHGLNVLSRMLQFAINCGEVYERAEKHKPICDRTGEYRKLLQAIKDGKVKLTEAPRNQIYVVGFASNDTI